MINSSSSSESSSFSLSGIVLKSGSSLSSQSSSLSVSLDLALYSDIPACYVLSFDLHKKERNKSGGKITYMTGRVAYFVH